MSGETKRLSDWSKYSSGASGSITLSQYLPRTIY